MNRIIQENELFQEILTSVKNRVKYILENEKEISQDLYDYIEKEIAEYSTKNIKNTKGKIKLLNDIWSDSLLIREFGHEKDDIHLVVWYIFENIGYTDFYDLYEPKEIFHYLNLELQAI